MTELMKRYLRFGKIFFPLKGDDDDDEKVENDSDEGERKRRPMITKMLDGKLTKQSRVVESVNTIKSFIQCCQLHYRVMKYTASSECMGGAAVRRQEKDFRH